MAGVSAVSASVMPISRPSAGRPLPGSCNSRNFRKRYANGRGLAWQAWDGKLREHGSWRPGILLHRMEVRKSTSGAAACSVTERWRCGRLSRRASMMPILSKWGSADIRHNIAQERQGKKTCAMAALRARKIILSYRRRGRARVHAVHSIGTTTSTKSAAPDPPRCQRPASCMDKDDEPKPVADYWINPAFK